ncbi:hypothetical protein GARCT_01581 [Geobacillus sp. 12AMOR1]|nr:hypothetical protein GARCT_01581 [Geobacillus sp. 12AMOR1]
MIFDIKRKAATYNITKGGRDGVKEIEVIIDTEEIAEFFYQQLIRRGFVPTQEELEELADITFDYLLEKCIIDEEIDVDDE